MKQTGITNLPLHSGSAPRWLFKRMKKLSSGIAECIVSEFGSYEFLKRISNPYWFQAFSCVIGFDWHSSGTTTTTCGALKAGLDFEQTGIFVAGGKGRASRNTLSEIEKYGDSINLPTSKIKELKYASKASAKVDNSCIQDGFKLYHHALFFDEAGEWCVVQQGMNESFARRYQWLSGISCYIEEPHTGISSDLKRENVLNMTAEESRNSREISVDLINDNPRHLRKYFTRQRALSDFVGGEKIEFLNMPAHHPILSIDLNERDFEVLQKAYEIQPQSYEELMMLKGFGPKKIRALALISDLIYGEKPSWQDPVKYSFAHGGKDGFPYPVDREVYDNSTDFLKGAIEGAKIGKNDQKEALKRLERFL